MTTAELDNLPEFQDDIAVDLGEEFPSCDGDLLVATRTAGELSLFAVEASAVMLDEGRKSLESMVADTMRAAGKGILDRVMMPVDIAAQQLAMMQAAEMQRRGLVLA